MKPIPRRGIVEMRRMRKTRGGSERRQVLAKLAATLIEQAG